MLGYLFVHSYWVFFILSMAQSASLMLAAIGTRTLTQASAANMDGGKVMAFRSALIDIVSMASYAITVSYIVVLTNYIGLVVAAFVFLAAFLITTFSPAQTVSLSHAGS